MLTSRWINWTSYFSFVSSLWPSIFNKQDWRLQLYLNPQRLRLAAWVCNIILPMPSRSYEKFCYAAMPSAQLQSNAPGNGGLCQVDQDGKRWVNSWLSTRASGSKSALNFEELAQCFCPIDIYWTIYWTGPLVLPDILDVCCHQGYQSFLAETVLIYHYQSNFLHCACINWFCKMWWFKLYVYLIFTNGESCCMVSLCNRAAI